VLISPFEAIYGHPLVTLGLPTSPSNIPPPLFLLYYPTKDNTLDSPRHPPPKTHFSYSCKPQPSTDQRMGSLQGTSTALSLQPPWKGPLQVIFNNSHCCETTGI
jgi:hypothetical protein